MSAIQHALVIGGGNTALDLVQELRINGVPRVTMAIRRTEAELSGYAHEWAHAKQLGVGILERVQPIGVLGRDRVTGVSFQVAGGDQAIEVDTDLVVWAVGQSKEYPLAKAFGVKVKDGCIVADAEQRTSQARVWVVGDAANGGKEVVNAAAEAKVAAQSIDQSAINRKERR